MQHILLLHGALGSKDQLLPLARILEHSFQVHLFNFSGHGGRAFPKQAFSIPLFSDEILEYMQQHGIAQATVFGYSMDGYAAMYLAKQHADKVRAVITLATKFHWNEQVAAREIKMLDADTIRQKVPAFAAQLQQRHTSNNWEELLDKTKAMLIALGTQNALQPEEYAAITTPALLLLGDRDKMVTQRYTRFLPTNLITAPLPE